MKYLQGMRYLPLVLKADDSGSIKWWIDGAFVVHGDMKSHTGAMMSLGKGAAYTTSMQQKLNTKRSMETELVTVDDVMPQVIWTQKFLEAQGYVVTNNVVFQDNQSAMLLERNGMQKRSSSKQTRHIDIRYFFVMDQIVAAKELSVEYCPTGEMVGDFFTKLLQGASFQKLWNRILNLRESDLRCYLQLNEADACPDTAAMHHRSVLGNNDEADAQRPGNSSMNHRTHDGDDDVSIGRQGEGTKKEH